MKGVELEKPAHAWERVAKLAMRFNLPGCRIAVKDEHGDIAILVGARTPQRMLSAQAVRTGPGAKKAPAEVAFGGGFLWR